MLIAGPVLPRHLLRVLCALRFRDVAVSFRSYLPSTGQERPTTGPAEPPLNLSSAQTLVCDTSVTDWMTDSIVLTGTHVRLEPMVANHADRLSEVGLDPELWKWTASRVRSHSEPPRVFRRAPYVSTARAA
jgi:hypothetical protein